MTNVSFPLGHYLGEFASDEEFDGGHQVRVGQDTISLTDNDFVAWAQAHEQSTPNEELSELGVLFTVTDANAEQFAIRYRLRPLLTALGKSGGNVAIGLGTQITVATDDLMHQLWWWAGPSKNLWELCGQTGPATEVLQHFLQNGHALFAGGAAYLDLA